MQNYLNISIKAKDLWIITYTYLKGEKLEIINTDKPKPAKWKC